MSHVEIVHIKYEGEAREVLLKVMQHQKEIETEVERLRDLLRRAPRGVGDDGPWLEWWREVSRALEGSE